MSSKGIEPPSMNRFCPIVVEGDLRATKTHKIHKMPYIHIVTRCKQGINHDAFKGD
jgi:hypothetical protein